jgi:hypothetical protein
MRNRDSCGAGASAAAGFAAARGVTAADLAEAAGVFAAALAEAAGVVFAEPLAGAGAELSGGVAVLSLPARTGTAGAGVVLCHGRAACNEKKPARNVIGEPASSMNCQ